MADKQQTWTILKVLGWTKGYLAGKGVENARLEAEWLLCEVLGLDRVGLYVNFERPLSVAELARFREMVGRRARREPLQYILGSQEFMGLEFEVAPGVLIPRADTETLVKEAVRLGSGAGRILDIGVGSGCISVALAKLLPGSMLYGVDQSAQALAIARRNAARHGVQVVFHEGSLFDPFSEELFEVIVSNPPYIPTADLAGLQPEVSAYEPRQALDGGTDGLDFYRAIVPVAPAHLKSGGWLLLEVGINQAAEVCGLFRATGRYHQLFAASDAAGIKRVVGGRLL